MFCRNCGYSLSDAAAFCPKCGTPVVREAKTGGIPPKRRLDLSPAIGKTTSSSGLDMFALFEGVLSILLALMVLFAPVIKVDYFFSSNSLSMLALVTNLTRYSEYLGRYAIIGPILGIFMIAALLGAGTNAVQCLKGELPQDTVLPNGTKISNSRAGAVTGYAVALLLLLWWLSHESYGIGGASGWAWVLLFGGLACQAIHFLRRSQSGQSNA